MSTGTIDKKILDFLTWTLTIYILILIWVYLKGDGIQFYSSFQKVVAMSFYIAYAGHLFLIIRSFRRLGDGKSNPNKEFGASNWLNSKVEIWYRFIVIIVALCVSGHISEVAFDMINGVCKLCNSQTNIHLSPAENFTFFSLVLSCLILLWDLIWLTTDFIWGWNMVELKKMVIDLNWPLNNGTAKAKNKDIFNLMPPRAKYLLGDIIAIIFWSKFYDAVFNTKNFQFVEFVSILIVIYCLLILYRFGAVRYKFE